MTDDLTFEELPPGRYKGTVEKIRYSFKAAATSSSPTSSTRRTARSGASSRGSPSTLHPRRLFTSRRRSEATGGRHPPDQGLSLADAQAAGGLRALPGLLEGSAICVVTRNRRVAGFDCPVVDHIED